MPISPILLIQVLSLAANGVAVGLFIKLRRDRRRARKLARQTARASEEGRKAVAQALKLVDEQLHMALEVQGQLSRGAVDRAKSTLSILIEQMGIAIEMRDFFMNDTTHQSAPYDLNHILEMVAGELPQRCELELALPDHAVVVHAPKRLLMLALEHLVCHLSRNEISGKVLGTLQVEGARAKVALWTAEDALRSKSASPPAERFHVDSAVCAAAGEFLRSIRGELILGATTTDPSAEIWLPLMATVAMEEPGISSDRASA